MTVAMPTLLQVNAVNERVDRLRVVNTIIQEIFGIEKGGPSVRRSPTGRSGSYDTIDSHRNVATARLPGAASGTVNHRRRGNVPFVIPRIAEKKPVLMEQLVNMRPLGGPTNVIDEMGTLYVSDEEADLKQRITNAREFQAAAMLRGQYTYTQNGDDLVHGFSGGQYTIDFKMPAGNKNQLNMAGDGDILGTAWDNPAAPILSDLFEINAAMIKNTGRGLSDVLVTSVGWGFIISNTQVKAAAGTAAQCFTYINKSDDTEVITAKLIGAPWITFHIIDQGLNIGADPTFTKLIPDTAAVFVAGPKSGIVRAYECGEPVVEKWNRRSFYAMGEYYWYDLEADPASYMLYSLNNSIPALIMPYAVAFGTIDF